MKRTWCLNRETVAVSSQSRSHCKSQSCTFSFPAKIIAHRVRLLLFTAHCGSVRYEHLAHMSSHSVVVYDSVPDDVQMKFSHSTDQRLSCVWICAEMKAWIFQLKQFECLVKALLVSSR